MAVHIFGGGTVQHIRSHLALCTPAYGNTARILFNNIKNKTKEDVHLHLTKMADYRSNLETNQHVEDRLKDVLKNKDTRCIIFNIALCDYSGQIGDIPSGKKAQRLHSREGNTHIVISPTNKLLHTIKRYNPDIKVVGFKTTADNSLERQIELSLRQIEETGVDYVFANDIATRQNLIVTKEGVLSGSREYLLCKIEEFVLCQKQ